MRLFVRQGYQLSSLQLGAKLVYTIFLLFISLGIWSSWDLYRSRIGSRLESPAGEVSVQDRYVNRVAAPPTTSPPDATEDGPALDLEGDDDPTEAAATAEPAGDLKEPWVKDVFHQHLFTVSVVFLILAHLFMLTALHPWAKNAIIVLAGAGSLLHVLAPVIIWKTAGYFWLMPVTGATMGLSWTIMIVLAFVGMWFGSQRP